jgi:hypothetical protein
MHVGGNKGFTPKGFEVHDIDIVPIATSFFHEKIKRGVNNS